MVDFHTNLPITKVVGMTRTGLNLLSQGVADLEQHQYIGSQTNSTQMQLTEKIPTLIRHA